MLSPFLRGVQTVYAKLLGRTGSLSSPLNWRLLVLVSSAFLVLWI